MQSGFIASSIAGAVLTVVALAGCAPELVSGTQSRVWSTANSNEGYASCPRDTTVTGGGFELKDQQPAPGKAPLVVASRPEANGWKVVCLDVDGNRSTACRAWAVCASVLAR